MLPLSELIHSLEPAIAIYGPLALLPLMLVEAPLMTIAAGFLVGTGTFNLTSAFFTYLIADIVMTHFYYWSGQGGTALFRRFSERFYFNLRQDSKLLRLKDNLEKALHHRFNIAYSLAKLIPIPYSTITATVLAGSMHIPYQRFIKLFAVLTLLQGTIFLAVGYALAQGILFTPTPARLGGLLAVVIIVLLSYLAYRLLFNKSSFLWNIKR